ncbi:MAG TPA: SemiSWEET transporter [Salinimicrobium sp.]|nr:SemiSWEET transporter [Salinimicrobium sp.]
MDWTNILGLTAGLCTTVAVVPQLIKAYKTKEAEDVSLKMFLVLLTGLSLWVVYGIIKKDFPIIITNSIAVILNSLMLYFIFKYGKE